MGGSFSPNGDGLADQAILTGQFSEFGRDWTLTVANASGEIQLSRPERAPPLQVIWNPLASAQSVPDGIYTVTVSAVDAWQNRRPDSSGTISVDANASQLVALSPAPTTISSFSPNGDGYRDTVALTATTSEPGSLAVGVRDTVGTISNLDGRFERCADECDLGRSRGRRQHRPDGRYVLTIAPVDAGGNVGTAQERSVSLVTAH